MPDTSTAITPLRPVLRERGGYSVKQARDDCRAFELKANIILYIFTTLVVSFLHGVDPRVLFYVSLKYIYVTVALVFGIICWMHSDGIFFIFNRRPYDVGDWIEFDPSESSVSLDTRKTWRVDRVTLFHTDFVNLFNNRPANWCNKSLANRPLINWSRLPTKFQIIMQGPVDSWGNLSLFKKFHEQVKQFADDNPSEWFAVGSFMVSKIMVGKDHAEYCVEIRHRELWHELALVLDSKAKLIIYCQMLVGKLKINKKSAERHGSDLLTAFGCNDKGGQDDSDDNKIEFMEEEKKENDGAKKMDNTLEEGEQKEGDGEKDENDNDDGHRMNYRIFVR